MPLILHGYHHSVYQRIARVVLAEKGIAYTRREVNPFAADMPEDYLQIHPFGRVPTLAHDDFVLYETGAITRYIDEAFPGPSLQPSAPRHRARMAQIMSIVDSYGYVPMVRQVFAQRVFAPRAGRTPDEALIRAGIGAAHRVLGAFEALAAPEGPIAGGAAWSLADCHLAPMIAYFTAAPEGAEALTRYPKLSVWWKQARRRDSLRATDPGPPDAA